ncbi:DHA3 family tetracycline resistance protein-like MFS transporter [Thermosporothrix hazakensis]|jgi:DHA3 family tetracycline resistance protein-like MFS transporter|uniref:DHA3 family tetracycline resistance protein-like MFS transporter n=2 Tax=Thermosporothrix TaxID=768650 RepID=A0A326U954_THEHA|nr:MFS transporter [Thermosporothrix hazakensis]PZW23379.1 DHA3 family tetracycline resistance protein-like MFS transporter [Thermosporothrix hazakensis]BBH89724.1 tetracycline efflux MFS transporter TetA(P) [Thermosporothrix sp. COM3]GCE47913.1 tetracycline efflux MFS transporter TetA(P) [Thermosporothrix hazakensis]
MSLQRFNLPALPVYLLIVSIGAFAQTTVFTMNMLYQVEMVKLNPLQLVLVGTSLETVCFLSQVPTGIIADLYSRRLSVILGYLLTACAFLLEGLIPRFETILFAQVLWGIGATCIDGAQEAWITDEIGEAQAGRIFTRGAQLGQLASLIGIPFSVWLGSIRLNLPVVVGGLIWLLLSLTLLWVMPEKHFQPTPKAERNTWHSMGRQLSEGSKAVRRSPVLLGILGVTFFLGLSSEGFDRLQTAHFVNNFQFPYFSSVIWMGIINAGSLILSIIITEIIRRRIDITQSHLVGRTLFVLNLGVIGGIFCFSLASHFYLALLAFWSVELLRGTSRPLYMTWIAQNSESRVRATVFSTAGQVDAIGQIAGGPGVGYIGERFGIRAALLTTGALLSPIIPFFIAALRKEKVPATMEPIEATLQSEQHISLDDSQKDML